MIVSDKHPQIRDIIIEKIGRGATMIDGTGLYKGEDRKIIYTILSRKEMVDLRYYIREIDPYAFINVLDSSEIFGRGFKKIDD